MSGNLECNQFEELRKRYLESKNKAQIDWDDLEPPDEKTVINYDPQAARKVQDFQHAQQACDSQTKRRFGNKHGMQWTQVGDSSEN